MARRRAVALVLIAVNLAALGAGGWALSRRAEADALATEGRALLETPFEVAPELQQIPADDAHAKLERAVALGADDMDVRGRMRLAGALARVQSGDMVFAESELSAARGMLGWTAELRVVAAAIARARGELDDARAHAEQALAHDRSHRRALLMKADLALDAGEPEAARAALSRLAEQAPAVASVHNRLGLAHEALGGIARARAAFRKATELDGDHGNGWINLGRMLRRQGDLRGSLAAFDRAVAVAESDPDAHFGRGLARLEQGELEGARADFERMAELAPREASAVIALGDVAAARGDHRAALERYREALGMDDEPAAPWVKLGNELVRTGQPGHAVSAFREAIARDATLAAAHNGLGTALMHEGDREAAERSLRKAASLDRSDPNPFLNLGLLRERAGNSAGARQAWQQALERDPQSVVARRRLGP